MRSYFTAEGEILSTDFPGREKSLELVPEFPLFFSPSLSLLQGKSGEKSDFFNRPFPRLHFIKG